MDKFKFPTGVTSMRDRDDEEWARRLYDFEVELPVKTQNLHWYNPFPYLLNFQDFLWDKPLRGLKNYLDKKRKERPPILYFHRKFNRVPPIWECNVDDYICTMEAEHQFLRDRLVENKIIEIYEAKLTQCIFHNKSEGSDLAYMECAKEKNQLEDIKDAWQLKYGDLGRHTSARSVLNKQKNRLIEERYLARTKKPEETPQAN